MPSPEELSRTLEAMNRRYYDAFQSLDIELVDDIWWHDADATCVHPGWDARHGWQEIRASYEEIFGNTRSIRFALGDVRSHVVGSVAFVTSVFGMQMAGVVVRRVAQGR
jgi:ketosteroid isomerase-like protein